MNDNDYLLLSSYIDIIIIRIFFISIHHWCYQSLYYLEPGPKDTPADVVHRKSFLPPSLDALD